MAHHVIVDGNNLLHAMHAHAPVPHVGRETMVRIIERWAHRVDDHVTLVFDGSAPAGGLGQQFESRRIHVRFSAPKTADDVIVDLIGKARPPADTRVVSDDTALGHAARMRRCGHVTCRAFISELFAERRKPATGGAPCESETHPSNAPGASDLPASTDEWLNFFGLQHDAERRPDGPSPGNRAHKPAD